MPYKTYDEVPETLKTAGLTLEQANDWERYFDGAQDSKYPGAIAWLAFKRKYKKVNGKWVIKDSYKKNKEVSKMSEDKIETATAVEVKTLSKFQDDAVIMKLKDIISKLENAPTLEAAKILAVELKTLYEEEKKDEVKTEPAKPAEPAVATPEECKATPVVETPKINTSLSDVLKLNEELITQMGAMNTQIETLEKINTKIKEEKTQLSDKLASLEKELTTFKEQIEKERLAKFNEKLNVVFEKYCSFMGIPSSDQESVRKQMSTFSEDVLDKTLRYVEEKKLTQLMAEPVPQTVPSSTLVQPAPVQTPKKTPIEAYRGIKDVREKSDFIFEAMIGNKPWEKY